MAFGEVRAAAYLSEAGGGDDPAAAVVDEERHGPQRGLRGPAEHGTDEQWYPGEGGRHREAPHLPAVPGVADRRVQHEGEVQRPYHGVGDGQGERRVHHRTLALPGVRDHQGGHEDGGHRHGHPGPDQTDVRPDQAAQPGVAAPRVPEPEQEQQTLVEREGPE
ncbi:hypothetical protein GCM10027614_71940 [Micromonospora vulcania]